MHTNGYHISTYQRAATLDRVAAGTYLNTRTQHALAAMARQAKQARTQRARMGYRMRLAALTAADTRRGKVWP